MTHQELFTQITRKKSFLCVGLDTDLEKIPAHILPEEDPLFIFNKGIIDATYSQAVAYKMNTAFYESLGLDGWKSMQQTINYIREKHPEIFIIADAKRGDIGNTSNKYAEAFFNHLNVDAITVSPYMGEDSLRPFLQHDGKWTIILALTSNKGAADFQYTRNKNGVSIFEKVLDTASEWGSHNNTMFVVGATKAEQLREVRKIVPKHFLLIPGVGAQGGSLKAVVDNGINEHCGLLVNASRSIIYAGNDKKYDKSAHKKALELQKEMKTHLKAKHIV
jgi:orotidine-5'-phosphate decarboxylase